MKWEVALTGAFAKSHCKCIQILHGGFVSKVKNENILLSKGKYIDISWYNDIGISGELRRLCYVQHHNNLISSHQHNSQYTRHGSAVVTGRMGSFGSGIFPLRSFICWQNEDCVYSILTLSISVLINLKVYTLAISAWTWCYLHIHPTRHHFEPRWSK